MSEVSIRAYRRLVDSLRRQIAESRRVIERQHVVTYWAVGRSMQVFLDESPGWGTEVALARRLSEDLGTHVRTLQQALQFFRAYPQLGGHPPLSWSHYRVLMAVATAKERGALQRRALREHLSVNDLRRLVYEAAARGPDGKTMSLLPAARGRLYHYRLIKVSYVNDAPGGLMVDCGFEVRIVPPAHRGTLDNTRLVRAVKREGVYRLVLSSATVKDIFTYQAVIERVVDGDTLLANIDAGFGLWTRQYLRLNHIDAPEARSAGGLAAKNVIAQALGRCPFVIIRTHKSDKFDRYLADVFYLPGEADPGVVAASGRYLNQELLDQGLVKIWMP